MRIFEDITKTVGQTPLVKLKKMSKGLGAQVFLKLEFFNPLGSVKDRIGLNMIEQAELNGFLKPGMEVVEPTSGNTGIALAFVCASRGYPLTLTMPETMSQERRTLLLLLGAKIILTPGALGMRGAVAKALELKDQNKNIFVPSQFENPANPMIHQETTALEIWRDTDGFVDMVVCGVGTSGTLTGIGRVLKSKKPTLKMVAVEPVESAILSGGSHSPHKIQGIGAGFVPKNFDRSLVDIILQVSSDEALKTAREVIKQEGIPVGISSGAALCAGLKLAAQKEYEGKNIVIIIPSCSERYLSTLLAQSEREQALALPVATVDEKYLNAVL